MLPLEGTAVVAVEHAVAAPLATRHLADLGATVVKVERPGSGDFARGYDATVRGLSSHFVWLNRSKESLALDLKRPEGKGVIRRLLDRADVFVHNLGPGAAQRLGLGAPVLQERHPALVQCVISGYGSSGPYAGRKAYDLLIQAETGLVSVTGTADEPAKVGIAVADIAAGMYAYSGILAALLERARTGRGRVVEVSLFDALAEWMGHPAYYTHYGGSAPARHGASHAAIAPYGPFPVGGEQIVLAVQNDPEWVAFCAVVLQRPDLTRHPHLRDTALRVAHRAELCELIEAVFAGLSAPDVLSRLETARIAHGRLNTVQQFLEHPQLAARNRWRKVDSPVGMLDALLPPTGLDGAEARMDPIPDVGEHSERILHSLGYSPEEVADLRRQGVTGWGPDGASGPAPPRRDPGRPGR